MFDLFGELLRVSLGVGLGILAACFAVVTIRVWFTGSDAYESNRAATPSSVGAVLAGQPDVKCNSDSRNSHGLAISLVTGKFVSQQRLSKEAVDDVIGRRF